MDLEYNDDDIGSLEGCEEATRGPALHDGNSLIQHVLDDYQRNYRKGKMVVCALLRLMHEAPQWCGIGS
jgi:hypothetical protein